MPDEIRRRTLELFHADIEIVPPMTLRGGDAVDRYTNPPRYDPVVDGPTDGYLEQYAASGLAHLDAASWRHYLPRLIDYALRHLQSEPPGTMAIDALLWSLRPPDREPPRLGSLSMEQEAVIAAFLETLAFGEGSAYQDFAMQILEEYWIPNALYRERPCENPQQNWI
ncbi:MAG: DUF6714 family protein [bacterium]